MSAAGVTYANLETLEVLLGTGNDTFTVTGTAAGAITAVHGGGGGDHIIVTGGGGPTSPLLVYGDTTQDRSRYTADGGTPQPRLRLLVRVPTARTPSTPPPALRVWRSTAAATTT